MARYFTLAEAERLVPEVGSAIREAISLKAAYKEAEDELQAIGTRITLLGGASVDRGKLLGLRKRRDSAAQRLTETIQQIQASGCLVKDLDIGLIDFPTLYRGREVYLCWKLGEPRISFWHGIDEGFRGRKSIDQEFLDHHEGGSD
jgi:hypothetical protein